MDDNMNEAMNALTAGMESIKTPMREVCAAAGGKDLEAAALIMVSEEPAKLPVLFLGQGENENEESTTKSVMFAALSFCISAAKHLAADGNSEAATLATALEDAMSATIDKLKAPTNTVH